MTRRRYIQIDGVLVEVGEDYVADRGRVHDSVLWNDREYQDVGDARFSSRTQHREYMRARGLTTVDDYKGEFAQAAKAREEHFTRAPDKQRGSEIARAYEKVRAGYKPKVTSE